MDSLVIYQYSPKRQEGNLPEGNQQQSGEISLFAALIYWVSVAVYIPMQPNQSCVGQLSLRDQILSLTYRISHLQSALTQKIDRNECLSILETKTTDSQLHLLLSQLETRVQSAKQQEEDHLNCIQREAAANIAALSRKLKSLHPQKHALRPQQLYLESNQTMFAMIVQELQQLQGANRDLKEMVENKHRKAVSLNNEVCRKITRLEEEIQEVKQVGSNVVAHGVSSQVIRSGGQRAGGRRTKVDETQSNAFESLRLELLCKASQSLQAELLTKINIRDVIPLVKQQLQPHEEELEALRDYFQESVLSTKKILTHQSDINASLCEALQMGRWHSIDRKDGLCLWNKQVVNLLPEAFDWTASCMRLRVTQQGNYLLCLNPIGWICNRWEISINTQLRQVSSEEVLRLQKGSEIGLFLKDAGEVYLSLQKL